MNSMNEALSIQETHLQATQILSPRDTEWDEAQAAVAAQRVSSHILGITFNSSQQPSLLQSAGLSKLGSPTRKHRLISQPLQPAQVQALSSPNIPLQLANTGKEVPVKIQQTAPPTANITLNLLNTPNKSAVVEPNEDHSHYIQPTQLVEDEPFINQTAQLRMDTIPDARCQDAAYAPNTLPVVVHEKVVASRVETVECAEVPPTCHHVEMAPENITLPATQTIPSSKPVSLVSTLLLQQTALPTTSSAQATVLPPVHVPDDGNNQQVTLAVTTTDGMQPVTSQLLQTGTVGTTLMMPAVPLVSAQHSSEAADHQQPAPLAQNNVAIPDDVQQAIDDTHAPGPDQMHCPDTIQTNVIVDKAANAEAQQSNGDEYHKNIAVRTCQPPSTTPNVVQTIIATANENITRLPNTDSLAIDAALRPHEQPTIEAEATNSTRQAVLLSIQDDYGRLQLDARVSGHKAVTENVQADTAGDVNRTLNHDHRTSSPAVQPLPQNEQHSNGTTPMAKAVELLSKRVTHQNAQTIEQARHQDDVQREDRTDVARTDATTSQPAADMLAPYRLLMSKLNSGFIAGHEKAALASTILTMSAKCIVAEGMGTLKEGADTNALLNNVQCMELAARQQMDLLNFSYSLNPRSTAENHLNGSPAPHAASIHILGMGDLAGISQKIRIGSDEVAELRTETPLSLSSAPIRHTAGSWQAASPPGSSAVNEAIDDLADISDGECMYYIKRASKITSRLTYQQYKEHSIRRGSMTPSRSSTPLSSSPATPYTNGLSLAGASARTPTNMRDAVTGSLFSVTPNNACITGSKLTDKVPSPLTAPQQQFADKVSGNGVQAQHDPAQSPAELCTPLMNASDRLPHNAVNSVGGLQTESDPECQLDVIAQAAAVQQFARTSRLNDNVQGNVFQPPIPPIDVSLPVNHDRATMDAVTPTNIRTAAAQMLISPNHDPSKGSAGRGTTSSLDKTLSRTALATSSEDDLSLRGPSAVSRALKQPLAGVSAPPGLNSAQPADRVDHVQDDSQSQQGQILTLAAGLPSASKAHVADARDQLESNTGIINGNKQQSGVQDTRMQGISLRLFGDVGSSTQPVIRTADQDIMDDNRCSVTQPPHIGNDIISQRGTEQRLVTEAGQACDSQDTVDGIVPASITSQDEAGVTNTTHAEQDNPVHNQKEQQQADNSQHASQQHVHQVGLMGPPPPRPPRGSTTSFGHHGLQTPVAQQAMGVRLSQVEMTQNETQTDPETLPMGRPASVQAAQSAADMNNRPKVSVGPIKDGNRVNHIHNDGDVAACKQQTAQGKGKEAKQRARVAYPPTVHTVPRRKNPSLTVAERNAAMQRQAAQLASIAAASSPPLRTRANVELSRAPGSINKQPKSSIDAEGLDKQKAVPSKTLSTGELPLKRNRDATNEEPDPYRYPDTQEHEVPQEDPPLVCRNTRAVALAGSADSNDISIAGSQPGLRSKQRLLIHETADTQEHVEHPNVLGETIQALNEGNHANKEQQDRVSKRRKALLGDAIDQHNARQGVANDHKSVIVVPAVSAKGVPKGTAISRCKIEGMKHRPVRSTRKPAGFYKQLDGSNSQCDVAGTPSQAGDSSIQPEQLQEEEEAEGENDDDIWSSLRLLDSSDEQSDSEPEADDAVEELQVEEHTLPKSLHEVMDKHGPKQAVQSSHRMVDVLGNGNANSNRGQSTPNTADFDPVHATDDQQPSNVNSNAGNQLEGSTQMPHQEQRCKPSSGQKASGSINSTPRVEGQQKRKLGCSKCRYSSAGCLKCRATSNRSRQPSRPSSPSTATTAKTPSTSVVNKATAPSNLTTSRQHAHRTTATGNAAMPSKHDPTSGGGRKKADGVDTTAVADWQTPPASTKPSNASILGKRAASDEGQTEFQEMMARTKRSRSLGIFGGLKFLLTGQLHPSKCSKTDRAGIREELAQKIIYNGGTLVTDLPEVHVPWLSASDSPNAKGQRMSIRRRSLGDVNPHGDASEFPDVVITDDTQATCRLLSCIARGAAVLTSSWLLTSLHELRVIEPGAVAGGMLVHPPRSHLKAAGPLTGLYVLVAGTPKFCRSFGAALAHAGAVLVANLPHRTDSTTTPAHQITRTARSVFWTSASPTPMARTNTNQEPSSPDKQSTLHLVVLEDECLLDNPADATNLRTGRGRNSGPVKLSKASQRQSKPRDAGGLSSQDPASPDVRDALAPKLATLQRSAKAMGIPVRGRDWIEQVLRQGQLPEDFFQLGTGNVGEPSSTPSRYTHTTRDTDNRDCRTPAVKSPVRSPLLFPLSLLETSSSPSAPAVAKQSSPLAARQDVVNHNQFQQALEEHQHDCDAHDSQAMQVSEFSFGFLGRDACSQQLLPRVANHAEQACHVCASPRSPVHTPTRSMRTQDSVPYMRDGCQSLPCPHLPSAETSSPPPALAMARTAQPSPCRQSLIQPPQQPQQRQQHLHPTNDMVSTPTTRHSPSQLNAPAGQPHDSGVRVQWPARQQSPDRDAVTGAVEIQGLLPEVPAPQGNLHTHYSGILLDTSPVRLGECIEMCPWAGEQLPCVVRLDRVWSHPLPGRAPRWYASVTRLCFPQATEFNMMSPGSVPMLYLTPDRIERICLTSAVRRVRVVMGMMAASGLTRDTTPPDYICNFEYNPDTMMLAPFMVTQQQPITG